MIIKKQYKDIKKSNFRQLVKTGVLTKIGVENDVSLYSCNPFFSLDSGADEYKYCMRICGNGKCIELNEKITINASYNTRIVGYVEFVILSNGNVIVSKLYVSIEHRCKHVAESLIRLMHFYTHKIANCCKYFVNACYCDSDNLSNEVINYLASGCATGLKPFVIDSIDKSRKIFFDGNDIDNCYVYKYLHRDGDGLITLCNSMLSDFYQSYGIYNANAYADYDAHNDSDIPQSVMINLDKIRDNNYKRIKRD